MYTTGDVHFFRFVLMTFKILGLAPFSMKVERKNGNIMIKLCHSWLGKIYNILLILLPVISTQMTLNDVYKNREIDGIETGFTVAVVCLFNILFGIIIIFYCYNQDGMVVIVNRLIYIDNKFNKQLNATHYFRNKKYIGLSFYIMYILINIIARIASSKGGTFKLVRMIGPVISIFVAGCFIIQYTVMLIYLESKFHSLNEWLCLMANPKSHIEFQNNTEYITYKNLMTNNLLANQKAQRILFEISREFSDLFGWPIFFSITFSCTKLIYSTYKCISPLFFMTDSSKMQITIIVYLTQMVKDLFPMIILSIYGTKIITEVGISIK